MAGRRRRVEPPVGEREAALTLEELRTFVAIAEQRSIQAAARGGGGSRGTYVRVLRRLEQRFGAHALLERAPGQRRGLLTPQGQELLRRARALLEHVDQWLVDTRDAVGRERGALRVGTLPGSFDLIAEPLTDLRRHHPELALRVSEHDDAELAAAIRRGEVDLGFGPITRPQSPAQLSVEVLGELSWAVIVPRRMAGRFGEPIALAELGGVPLVVLRSGPARERIEQAFASHKGGALRLDAAFEVGSTPRIVELVSRGFGPAIVSRFRLAFLPADIVVRTLVDGPLPLRAGVVRRRGATPNAAGERLLALARARFSELAGTPVGAARRRRD